MIFATKLVPSLPIKLKPRRKIIVTEEECGRSIKCSSFTNIDELKITSTKYDSATRSLFRKDGLYG